MQPFVKLQPVVDGSLAARLLLWSVGTFALSVAFFGSLVIYIATLRIEGIANKLKN